MLSLREQDTVEDKISSFMRQLKSRDPEDVKSNAEILAEILKSFSISFNVDVEQILEIMNEQRGGRVNLQQIRNTLFDQYN
jgi:hypothetical protein